MECEHPFILALENIRKSDPRTVVARVLELFLKIATMEQEELIATYQTFWFFRQHMRNLDPVDTDRLDRIQLAFKTRMLALCAEPRDRCERARRVEVLGRVLSGSMAFGPCYRNLAGAIDGYDPSRNRS